MKSIDEIGRFSDSICNANEDEENIVVGFIYNLCDSTFLPSNDTVFNCVIPCGIGNVSHGKLSFDGNHSLITKIKNDSITVRFFGNFFEERIHISQFKPFYHKYINELLKEKWPKDIGPTSVTIDISNNPNKEVFGDIFKIIFWTYFDKSLNKLKTNPKTDLKKIADQINTNRFNHYNYLNAIYIKLTKDSVIDDYIHPILSR
jgi:hypothetical protein